MSKLRCARLVFVALTLQVFSQGTVCSLTASAELFVDAYGGVALPRETQASHTQIEPTVGSTVTPLDFGPDPSLGFRMGMWFTSPLPWIGKAVPWLGIAGDVSYFERKTGSTSINAIPLSVLLMLRLPILTSEQYPNGQLQPYVGAGPSFVAGESSIDVSPLTKTEDNQISIGRLDTRAGLLWSFHKHWSVFTEYRFTYFRVETADRRCPPPPQPCRAIPNDQITLRETNANIGTHHVVVGLRFTIR